jgi:hypothetical protein
MSVANSRSEARALRATRQRCGIAERREETLRPAQEVFETVTQPNVVRGGA